MYKFMYLYMYMSRWLNRRVEYQIFRTIYIFISMYMSRCLSVCLAFCLLIYISLTQPHAFDVTQNVFWISHVTCMIESCHTTRWWTFWQVSLEMYSSLSTCLRLLRASLSVWCVRIVSRSVFAGLFVKCIHLSWLVCGCSERVWVSDVYR